MALFLSPEDNLLALPEEQSNPETAGVMVLPVPYEQTSTYGRGSARGPQAIINASHEVELFDAALGFEPCHAAGGIATLEPLDVAGLDGPGLSDRLYQECRYWLQQKKMVVTIGGEHTSIIGAVRAYCEMVPDLTVVQLDAHSDLRDQYLDNPWNHACAMARVLDFHDDVVQIGIRSQAKEERALSEARKFPIFYAHDIHRQSGTRNPWYRRAIAATRPNVYVTLDCDVFDPAVIPGTGTPEPGGLSWQQIDSFLARLCVERNVVGFDVNELSPLEGSRHSEFTLAKLIYRFIGYRFMG
jgi:agmatinase